MQNEIKPKSDFRINATVILYRDFELRIKECFTRMQKDASRGFEQNPLLIVPPTNQAINEATEILYEAYLCGIDKGKIMNKSRKK